MLDKSVAYQNVVMVLPAARIAAAGAPKLPAGYRFRCYRPGDEAHWARIEASVLEFESEKAAKTYFEKAFLPFASELPRRCLFVEDQAGLPVATALAWRDQGLGLPHRAMLHWVAVTPEAQGLGLGGAVVRRAVGVCRTWSRARRSGSTPRPGATKPCASTAKSAFPCPAPAASCCQTPATGPACRPTTSRRRWTPSAAWWTTPF